MILDEQAIQSGDELLGRNVNTAILRKAEKWLLHFAATLGVEAESVRPSFVLQELGASYAYREVCRQKAYSTAGAWSDSEKGDYYAKKLDFYERRVQALEKRITAADLTGNADGRPNYRAVRIARG